MGRCWRWLWRRKTLERAGIPGRETRPTSHLGDSNQFDLLGSFGLGGQACSAEDWLGRLCRGEAEAVPGFGYDDAVAGVAGIEADLDGKVDLREPIDVQRKRNTRGLHLYAIEQ